MGEADKARLTLREHILVEDWEGPDADERQARGEPPDKVYEAVTVTDLLTGEVIEETDNGNE